MKPRRSVLYMPGANTRAMEKARGLDCDSIIFDLEDAVAPDAKPQARENVARALESGGYGYRELLVRANGLDTPWGKEDVARVAGLPAVHGLLFPKIESAQQVDEIVALMAQHGGGSKALWVMIETPRGVATLASFAGHEQIETLVLGTSDLVKELRALHTPERRNIDYALQHCLLIARMLGKDILDGVHLDFRNEASFELACRGGRSMGFDGKTLIHPSQIATANEVFGFSEEAIEHAESVLAVWQSALDDGRGVAVLDGQLIENLHAAEAERVVAFARAISQRQDQIGS